MKGKCWKSFKLQFSFIGWRLLAMLGLGIPFIWISPYVAIAQVFFYEWASGRLQNRTGCVTANYGGQTNQYGYNPTQQNYSGQANQYGDNPTQQNYGGQTNQYGYNPTQQSYGGQTNQYGYNPTQQNYGGQTNQADNGQIQWNNGSSSNQNMQ